MPASQIIVWMIICCVAFLILLFFSKPLKFLLRTALGASIGACGMLIANFVLTPLGVSVGINAVTLLTVGLLGIPGFMMLYITSMVL